MSSGCCSHNCTQGDDCPVRMATPLNTANSDGSDPHRDPIDDYLDGIAARLLLCIGLLLLGVAALLIAGA